MALRPDQLHGTFPAIITPFDDSGERIDDASLRRLIAFLLEARVDGVVACGSTGEAACLSLAEYEAVIARTCEIVDRRVPVVAGISLSSTAEAVETARIARRAGAEALLVAAPPYNKPSQEGIYRHTLAIHRASDLPIITYNIPGRSAVPIAAATTARMAADGFAIGCKESSGSIESVLDLVAQSPPALRILSGEDALVWPVMSCGGVGCISASANVVPAKFVALTSAAERGDAETARRVQVELLPIVRALFSETNPVPAKAALWRMGVIESPAVRLPLVRAAAATTARLAEVLKL